MKRGVACRASWTWFALVSVQTDAARAQKSSNLLVRGKANKQIADALGCTERTIKAHRQRVMEKMQVQSLAELVTLAERVGVLSGTSGNGPSA